MGLARSGLAVLLAFVLFLCLVTGNVVTAADRTVLDEAFVTTTLSEEDAYRTGQAIVAGEASNRIEDVEGSVPVPIDPERAANETITRSYLRNQTEANVDRAFEFLHGEREDPDLRVNLSPVKENVADLAERRIRERSVAELIEAVAGSRELTIDVAIPESNETVTVDLRVVGEMSRGPEAYRTAREDLRERFVNATYRARSPSELLVLVDKNPLAYNESERERIVRERESEIKSALEPRVRRELESAPERLAPLIADRVDASLTEEYRPAAEPTADLLVVGVRGLTTNMTYETFDAELSRAKSDLADNVSTVLRGVLAEEFPARLNLTGNLSADARERLDQARATDGTVALLRVLLPVVAILLIGLVYAVTRSPEGTAFASGVALAAAGAVGFLVGTVTPGLVESQVQSELAAEEVPQGAVDVAVGIVEQVFGALSAQSLVLVLLGGVLVAAGLYGRFNADDAGS